ncbi:polyprenyl synthetase family protein [Sorangium sp. So ce394]|uniref:polyprenyl synthetase family protein n=1 Tax=Sorangium sp. So ce394 TaxID=3133310 RepID=UPI003F5B69AE
MRETRDPIADGWALVATDRWRFEAALASALEPQSRYLTEVERQLYAGGKRLRPLLLLLATRAVRPTEAEGEVSLKAVQAAVSLEMLHVATLIHDDIVDSAELRRNGRAVHAARGVQTAVLVGDLQFIQAIRIFAGSVDTATDMGIVRLVLDVGFRICCGELDELRGIDTSEPEALRRHYRATIERKTAILFGLACEVGASLGGAGTRATLCLGQYGRSLGRAFQIMDDLLDLAAAPAASGKDAYTDLAQRCWTLPLINAVEELGPGHALSIHMRGDETGEDLATLAAAAVGTRGFERAYDDARREALEACQCLADLPASTVAALLGRLAMYVVDRGFGAPLPIPAPA